MISGREKRRLMRVRTHIFEVREVCNEKAVSYTVFTVVMVRWRFGAVQPESGFQKGCLPAFEGILHQLSWARAADERIPAGSPQLGDEGQRDPYCNRARQQ